MQDWTNIIDDWVNTRISYRQHRDDIVSLFKIAMENTLIPGKSWFGFPPTRASLNIIFGRVYLVGIFDRKIEIIVDTDIGQEVGFRTRIVRTSIPSGLNLYWISTDFTDIKDLIANEKIWQHYRIASQKVDSCVNIRGERKDWLTGKYLVKDIFLKQPQISIYKTIEQINEEFEEKVKLARSCSQQKRQDRLKRANKKPISTYAQVKIFVRNADVVAEVLQRANGHCEYCKNPAPFKKDNNGEGYLEVHHIISLAENGDDTIENAVALCPNCHKQAHYGKKNFNIEKFKFLITHK